MKNFIQPGDTLTLAAPYNRLSGEGALIGSGLFGVATGDVLNGVVGEFAMKGVFLLAKTNSQAWVVGDPIYWDNSTKLTTNVPGDLHHVGFCVEAVAATAGLITGKVLLPGVTQLVSAAAPTSAITDASVAHALNASFSDTEVEAALNALGTKINLILAALRAKQIIAD